MGVCLLDNHEIANLILSNFKRQFEKYSSGVLEWSDQRSGCE